MTEVKMFWTSSGGTTHDMYKYLNEKINDYAKENNLIIKSIHYDRLSDVIIVNVLFTDIPNELFLL